MSFGSDLLGKTSSLSLVSSTVQGKVGKAVSYPQVVTGSMGRRNRTVTRIYVEYWGSAKGKAGNAEFLFVLDTPAGRYEYQATASLASVALAQDGSAVYGSQGGTHAARLRPLPRPSCRTRGKITLTLTSGATGPCMSGLELVEVS